MRKLIAPIALTGLVALGLVACSSAPDDSGCEPRVSPDASAVDVVSVGGAVGALPVIDSYVPLSASTTQWKDAVGGEGPSITAEEQQVTLDLVLTDATTGETLMEVGYDGSPSTTLPLSQWAAPFPGLGEALTGACEGSRVVAVIAPDDIDPSVLGRMGLADTTALIAVADVRKVYLPKADGVDRFVARGGLPSVVRAEDGRPGVTIPHADPPEELVVEVLKEGSGETVTGDAPVMVAYTGVLWQDGTVFDSSWDTGAVPMQLAQVIPGFAEGLKGQNVGSQVLIVIPPAQGYGDRAQGSIPAGSTLVFVVDILGIDDSGR